MAINDLLPFAVAPSANVMTQAEYVALTARAGGFVSGVAQSEQLNKVWRQAAFVAAMIGQYTANNSDEDVLDNGDVDTFEQNFTLAVAATAIQSLPFATAAEVLAATLANKVVSPKTIAPAVQSGKWNYAVAGGTANALTVTLDPAPASYDHLRVLWVMPAADNAAGSVTINVNGLGARQIRVNGSNPVASALRAGVPGALISDGASWHLVTPYTPVVGAGVIWVRTDGSDANDGSANTSAAAMATISAAIAKAPAYTGGVTIRLGNTGNYAAPPNISSPTAIKIQGDTANQDAYQITGNGPAGGGGGVIQCDGGVVTFSGVKIHNGGTINHTVSGTTGASLFLEYTTFGGIGMTGSGHLFVASGASAAVGVGCKFTSSAAAMWFASGGSVTCNQMVTLVGTPNFASGTAIATTNGSIVVSGGIGFTGGATGPRYNANLNGAINTFGGGANFFPGNSAGIVSAGGQYV